MCRYCNGYWECDGEGGECDDVRAKVVAVSADACDDPQAPTWEVSKKKVALTYADGSRVKGQHGNVTVDVEATVRPNLLVTVNTHRVQGRRGGGTRVPYPGPPRNREWQINTVEMLTDKDGSPVLDEDGNQVKVRVQCYRYAKDDDHPPHHKEGCGPKLRMYAERP